MAPVSNHHATKVPAVTLGFWIIKILATTLGETGGNTFSMTMDLGYLVSTEIFLSAFYWAAITFSQTLGTALGDWLADTGLGYEGGALVFTCGLAALAAAYFWTDISRVLLFWAAFILTRPLGATVGDFIDKPLDHGGLALSRPLASAVVAALMIVCILLLPQRAGSHPQRA
jgi:uncharacterized membrane-anchored protein